MKSLMIIFAALLLTIAMPFIFDAIDNSITQEQSQNFSGVTTGAGEYTTNVTIGRAIWNNDTTSVEEITSNSTADSPTAYAYNSASRVLTVSGLAESEERTLAVSFLIESTTLEPGVGTFLTITRWFWVLGIICFLGVSVYAFFD